MIKNMLMDYENVLMRILSNGHPRGDRTGTGTLSVFGAVLEHDHRLHGFPLLSLKKTNWDAIVAELLWFIKGSTNTNDLNSKIWDEWADENGECGPIYGKQWRSWPRYVGAFAECDGWIEVDQLRECIDGIAKNPHGRRHIVSAWNPADIPDMALPPCHFAFQFYVEGDGSLSIMVHQRSADMMLGVPFNMASYSLLLHMVAHVVGREPGRHIHTLGDAHIYRNHEDAAREMISTRKSLPMPDFCIQPGAPTSIDMLKEDHLLLGSYLCHPAIKLPVAV